MSVFTRAVNWLRGQTSDLIHPVDARIVMPLGGALSYAGNRPTVDAAMQLSTAWACIRLISQTWGTLPVEVFEWDGKANRTTRNHPLYTLLHDAPNADMSAVEFWSAMGVSLMTWGNAYAEIGRTVGGRVVSLMPLDPAQMAIERKSSGDLVYSYTDAGGRKVDLDERDVLHIKGVTLNGIVGLSPIRQACNTLGLAMAADEAAGKLFSNGMRLNGHYIAPAFLTSDQRKQANDMLDGFRGAANAGRSPLLEGGFRFEGATLPPHEAELLATRGFAVEEIARWYGVPAFMVGHTEKSTSWGSGLESQMLAFHALTMRPILKNAEGAIERRLLAPGERGRISVDFNVEGLLRADSAGRASFLTSMVAAGVMTPNEARAKEGLEPLPGGDVLMTQSNQMPLSALGQATSRANLPNEGVTQP